MSADDEDVWLAVIKTIKPLEGKKPVLAPRRPAPKKPVQKAASPRKNLETILPRPAPRPAPSPLPTRRIKQLKQQKIPVERSMDLHSFTVERAHQAVMHFIGTAQQQGLRCIEIITGRGDPHRGTGQLKRLVPFWLEELKRGGLVLHIEQNPASRGGSFLILLRRDRGID